MNKAEEDALIAKIASDKNAFPLEDHTVEEIVVTAMRLAIRAAVAAERERAANTKLWLWKNFVDGKPEYWAFDNLYPINLDNDDPQTLGEPCGYAIFKPSRAAIRRCE